MQIFLFGLKDNFNKMKVLNATNQKQGSYHDTAPLHPLMVCSSIITCFYSDLQDQTELETQHFKSSESNPNNSLSILKPA